MNQTAIIRVDANGTRTFVEFLSAHPIPAAMQIRQMQNWNQENERFKVRQILESRSGFPLNLATIRAKLEAEKKFQEEEAKKRPRNSGPRRKKAKQESEELRATGIKLRHTVSPGVAARASWSNTVRTSKSTPFPEHTCCGKGNSSKPHKIKAGQPHGRFQK